MPPLFGLAPGGVCRAVLVTKNAVRSYRTLSPLPSLAEAMEGGLLSVALSLGSPPPEVIRHRASMEPGLSSPSYAIHEGGAAIRPADRGNKGFGAPRVKPTQVDWLLPPIGVPRNLWPARNGILIAALPFVLIS